MHKIWFNMKIVVALVVLMGVFLLGYVSARHQVINSFKGLDQFNTLARYETSRDIAIFLKNGNIGLAKCLADLDASSLFDDVRMCLSNKRCAKYIINDVKQRDPNMLEKNPKPSFDYLKSIDGKRSCH